MIRILRVTAAVVCALSAAVVSAGPITYEGTLLDGVTVTGTNIQLPGSPSDPVDAAYWSFTATAGSTIEVVGNRLTGPYDMSFWVMSGLFADTDDFGGSLPGSAAFSIFGDDQDPANIAGPFGDPHVIFVAPITGSYTVAVTNFLSSSSSSPPYEYDLTMNVLSEVPEPASVTLFGLGALGVAAGARRRRARQGVPC